MEIIGALIGLIISLFILVMGFVMWWKIFEKAGEAGWKIFIPFYNLYIIGKITLGNGWLGLVLLIIPYLDIIGWIVCNFNLGKRFGKDTGFNVLCCIPIVAFFCYWHIAFNPSCVYRNEN